MNDRKREKVVHCWGKTGLLAIWDVTECAALAPNAFAETSRLFHSRNNVDNSGISACRIRACLQPRWSHPQEEACTNHTQNDFPMRTK